MKNKKITTVVIIIVCVVLVYGAKIFLQPSEKEAGSTQSFRVKGELLAPIQITEFIDFECPACAAGAKYLKKLMKENPSAIQLELKYYPLRMHKHGLISAKYAECAGQQGQFWGFQDSLIKRQKLWHKLEDAKPAFNIIAKDLNLDIKELEGCLQSKETDKVIQRDRDEGKSIGIRSTPTYFVNGKMVVGTKSLKQLVEKFLAEGG